VFGCGTYNAFYPDPKLSNEQSKVLIKAGSIVITNFKSHPGPAQSPDVNFVTGDSYDPTADPLPSVRLFGCDGTFRGQAPASTASNPAPTTQATFDWKVADRLGDRDPNNDQCPDCIRYPDQATIQRTSYTVAFTANDPLNPACDSGNSFYTWQVDDLPEGASGTNCTWQTVLPDGAYSVTMTVHNRLTGTPTTLAPRQMTIKDWLIASIRDSVGSGEATLTSPSRAFLHHRFHRTPTLRSFRRTRTGKTPSAIDQPTLPQLEPP
jgi:hypothetical protein